MELSLFYFTFILFSLLLIVNPSEFDIQCPTSRRLLLFGRFNLPVEQKKSHHNPSASSPKYARSSDSHGRTICFRPQTSKGLGHKVRSYTHLLKSKLYTPEEKEKLKQLKKKNSTQHKSSNITTKTQELVTINKDELNRCKALLHIASTREENKNTKKSKKQILSSKIKNITTQPAKNIKKKVPGATTHLPIIGRKAKITNRNSKTNFNEKKTTKISSPTVNKTNEKRPFTSPVQNKPTKISPPPSQPTKNTKSKATKPETITIIQPPSKPFDATEDEIDDKNDSVVDRAYHFVKNIFQLSEDIINESQIPEDQIIDTTDDRQHHHHSRKLLSIDEDDETSIITNDLDFDIRTTDDLSIALTGISKRRLLSVKPTQNTVKDKKPKSVINANAIKPKVGWAYRYRISRYLNAQKMKRTGNKNKPPGGGGKTKPNQKKTISLTNTKISKRKLLEYNSDDDDSSGENDDISDQDIIKSVSITKNSLPKRQLLLSKSKEDNFDQIKTHRRKKSFEELTDPIAIVHSYERGLYKPRVGWQFRYRVSRYIDSLRENIRVDQERLKLGLQAIKRKTPQELSGRRKRVLDKPFAPDSDRLKKQQQETIINKQENKPNVGWRYRYRINKMHEAKKRGDYIDNDEEKRRAQKKKPLSPSQSPVDDDTEPIEGKKDLDPELCKINNEGRRVGWAYRYRIRRKLDYLKQQKAETGIPFDLATLSGKREKKVIEPKIKSTEKKTIEPAEQKLQDKTKSVGWEYRYRVSKMRDAQKYAKSKVSPSKKQEKVPIHQQLDPELAQLTPEERIVGWNYRYRIRRKLDSSKNTPTRDSETSKRAKKRKHKEKIINKVEESIEKILNIDDIDETPFMEYFRRASSYVLFALLPTAKKSLCLLPFPVTFSFCHEETNVSTTKQSNQMPIKKLKTKKEQRAKQFIRSHITKLGAEDKATERRVDETMKNLYKPPPSQTPPSPRNNQKKQRIHPPKQSKHHEKVEPIKKIGIKSNKNKNKKQFQIIGAEVKIKHEHLSPPAIVEIPKKTALPPLRSIAEVIQAEAATILATKRSSSRTSEEIQDEINETQESIQEQKKLTATTTPPPPTIIDRTTSVEEDNGSTSSTDNNNKSNGENVQIMSGLENDKNSS